MKIPALPIITVRSEAFSIRHPINPQRSTMCHKYNNGPVNV